MNQPDPGPMLVPIGRVYLTGPTFRQLERFANERHTTVAVLVSHLAERAVQGKQRRRPPRGYTRMTSDLLAEAQRRISEGATQAQAAAAVGVSTASLKNYLAERRAL